jgi:hypothetical protein
MEQNLLDKWDIWYHYDKDNWTLSGFKKIYEINTISDFWKLYNNWDKLGGVNNKHFFIMKKNIIPVWEDECNINGGCWSFKINEYQSSELWEDLSVYLVTNNLCPSYSSNIYGLSISLKKNNNSIIKIWNKDSSKNSLNLINKNILNKWGSNIIYIAHVQSTT